MKTLKKINSNTSKKKPNREASFWLFGLHAVESALLNAARSKLRLVVTRNAADKLCEAIISSGMKPELCDPKDFNSKIEKNSVHQGVALKTKPLDWGGLEDHLITDSKKPARLVLLDQITDPQNVGAILRTSEVLGVNAVIGTKRRCAPESGALAKAASGALERQPYLKVNNLAETIKRIQKSGYVVLGLDSLASKSLEEILFDKNQQDLAIVLGSEGTGLRQRTKEIVDCAAKIVSMGSFGSLNVSNAAAIALYATTLNWKS